jgi:hypothetical protein
MNLTNLLCKRPAPLVRIAIWLTAIITTALLGYLRMNSPATYEFHLFFLLPVVAVAWFVNLPRACMLAVLAVVLWYLAERQLTGGGLERGPLLFNSALRIGLFLAVAWLVAHLRSIYRGSITPELAAANEPK